MQELIQEIFKLKKLKEQKDAQIATLKGESDELDKNISEKSAQLLEAMKTAQMREVEVGDIKAGYFMRENIGYTSDSDVLNYLKNNGYTQYIKTKTTESLDKTPLKKAIKNDATLAQALESMTVKTVTEYAVVTTKDNYQAMLEHMGK